MTIQSFLIKHNIFVEDKYMSMLQAMINQELVTEVDGSLDYLPYLMSIVRDYNNATTPRQSSLPYEQDSHRPIC